MNVHPAFRLLLAAHLFCIPPRALAGEAVTTPGTLLRQLTFDGGSGDDVAFSRVAAALALGAPVAEGPFRLALEAIRNTDRFRAVTGELFPCPGGIGARIRLEPWPALEFLTAEGLPKTQLMGAPRLQRPLGNRRLEDWRREFQAHLQETGYPAARVTCERTHADRGLRVLVAKGPPDLLRAVVVVGNMAPYTYDQIIEIVRVVPGKTLWTAAVKREMLDRLRNKLRKDKRFESQVDMAWESGVLRLTVEAGPVVECRAEGDGLGWTISLKDVVGLARANRYSPELLDQADRRILRVLRGQGYLDAQVAHRREVLQDGPGGPARVRVTFTLHRGETSPIGSIRFEGNKVFPGTELEKAAELPFSFFSAPKATPELMNGVEGRIKHLYLSQGYPDVKVRMLPLQRDLDRFQLVYRVFEGPRRLVQWLKLDLPAGGLGDPWGLGECLTRILSERPLPVAAGLTRSYASDEPKLAGVEGILEVLAEPVAGGPTTLLFTLNRPIPFLRNDLVKIFTALQQQRLPALGVVRPVVRMVADDSAGRTGIHLVVPNQAQEQVRRIVVAGSDPTRALAILRETQLNPGTPLDPGILSRISFMGRGQDWFPLDGKLIVHTNPCFFPARSSIRRSAQRSLTQPPWQPISSMVIKIRIK